MDAGSTPAYSIICGKEGPTKWEDSLSHTPGKEGPTKWEDSLSHTPGKEGPTKWEDSLSRTPGKEGPRYGSSQERRNLYDK